MPVAAYQRDPLNPWVVYLPQDQQPPKLQGEEAEKDESVEEPSQTKQDMEAKDKEEDAPVAGDKTTQEEREQPPNVAAATPSLGAVSQPEVDGAVGAADAAEVSTEVSNESANVEEKKAAPASGELQPDESGGGGAAAGPEDEGAKENKEDMEVSAKANREDMEVSPKENKEDMEVSAKENKEDMEVTAKDNKEDNAVSAVNAEVSAGDQHLDTKDGGRGRRGQGRGRGREQGQGRGRGRKCKDSAGDGADEPRGSVKNPVKKLPRKKAETNTIDKAAPTKGKNAGPESKDTTDPEGAPALEASAGKRQRASRASLKSIFQSQAENCDAAGGGEKTGGPGNTMPASLPETSPQATTVSALDGGSMVASVSGTSLVADAAVAGKHAEVALGLAPKTKRKQPQSTTSKTGGQAGLIPAIQELLKLGWELCPETGALKKPTSEEEVRSRAAAGSTPGRVDGAAAAGEQVGAKAVTGGEAKRPRVKAPVPVIQPAGAAEKVACAPAAGLEGLEWLRSIDVHTDEVVNCLADIFNWPAYYIRKLYETYGVKALEAVWNFFDNGTYSTAFSGIDAPGVAIREMESGLQTFFGRNIKGMRHVSAVATLPLRFFWAGRLLQRMREQHAVGPCVIMFLLSNFILKG